MILSSLGDLSSPVALMFESISFKSQTSDGSGPRGLPWPQDVQQELQQRFWQGLWFPCNCLLMTCTAVRSGGNVLNNVTWQARLSLFDQDPKHFSSKYFIFYCLIVRVRLHLPFQSFATCNRSYSVLILRLPIACLGHDKNLAKNQAFFWQLYTDITFTWTVIFPVLTWLRQHPE